MNWKQGIREVTRLLGKKKLVWFGTRGSDAQSMFHIPQFREIFSIISPVEDASAISEVCLEDMTRRRINNNTYEIHLDNSPEVQEFRRRLFISLGEASAIVAYRPVKVLTTAYFLRLNFVEYLGLLEERQAQFNYKPFIETELRKIGVRTIPWQYYGEHNFPSLVHILEQGPVVIRQASRSMGGEGLLVVDKPSNIEIKEWPSQDGFLAIAPYLEPNVALNVNACVFKDGSVSIHAPSVQLIGIPLCTNLPLGYCGNDFGQIRNLASGLLSELETMTIRVGKWLAHMGYLGAFGIDAIAYHDKIYLTEVNPRFQNSSVIAAQIDMGLDRVDIYLNHMTAFFGHTAPQQIPLKELAQIQPCISQVICYNRSPNNMLRSADNIHEQGYFKCMNLPKRDVSVVPGGMLFRGVINDLVTTDGYNIIPKYESQLQGLVTDIFETS